MSPVIPSSPSIVSGSVTSRHGLEQRVGRVDDDVVLPAERGVDEVADLDAVGVRRHDLADAVAPHRLAEGDRRHVAADVVEPPPLGRVERQPPRAQQHLAVAGLGDRRADELEVLVADLAGRALAQHQLAVGLTVTVEASPASSIAARIAIGVSGWAVRRTPRWARASATALTTAGGEPMAPPSPMPL